MAILIDETQRVLVQGITGREGRARTRLMREYGTNVVAGVTPGKGGENVLGVPVFNTPQDAVKALGKIDISVLFVTAAGRGSCLAVLCSAQADPALIAYEMAMLVKRAGPHLAAHPRFPAIHVPAE